MHGETVKFSLKELTTPRPTWLLAPWGLQGPYLRHRRERFLLTAKHLPKFYPTYGTETEITVKFSPTCPCVNGVVLKQ
jgi:hypothetical protein